MSQGQTNSTNSTSTSQSVHNSFQNHQSIIPHGETTSRSIGNAASNDKAEQVSFAQRHELLSSSSSRGTHELAMPHDHSRSFSKKNSRKRSRQNRVSLAIAPDPQPHQIPASFEASSSDDSEDMHSSFPNNSRNSSWKKNPENDRPDTTHLSTLIACLILTTALGVLAGLDAKRECMENETNTLIALREGDDYEQEDQIDDEYAAEVVYEEAYEEAFDEAYLKEAENGCIRLFRRVMMPAMLITTVAGVFGLLLLRSPSHQPVLMTSPTAATTVIPSPTDAFNLSLRLLVLVTVILAAQMYNLTYIMLSPRRSDIDYSENPFHSLAAVDLLGHVSDNANLYYLTWLSVGITMALFYQTVTATVRAGKAVQVFRRNSALLPATSWYILSVYEDQESRHAWYESIYKLRIRTGVWTAAFLSCSVITASSQYIWKEVLWPYHEVETDDDNYDQEENADSTQDSMESLRGLHFSVCQTIYTNSGETISVAMCRRTAMAWLAGVLAIILCGVAIGIHLVARTTATNSVPGNNIPQSHANVFRSLLERHRVPLGMELILSIIVSLLLGYNALFATSLNGPAANVGNLYYASWLSFLLLIRICLGCLEEWCEVKENEQKPSVAASSLSSTKAYQAPDLAQKDPIPTDRERARQDIDTTTSSTAAPSSQSMQREHKELKHQQSILVDETEKDRVQRLRLYFCLSIFSTICATSARDAAANEGQSLNKTQYYILLAPILVASISTILFLLCLSKRCYKVASHFFVGGVLAVICFGLWMADLVLTMHSEESWAINRIGEIKMANLYYFTWASILTAGLQLSTFVKALFPPMTDNDTMSIVWIGICKVCFVIFGAGMHIWLNISDKCDLAQLTTGAVTFCSRTVLAIIVSLTGMLVGGLVVLTRFIQRASPSCQCDRFQAHIEIILSSFLLLLFAAAVALITGIGGPGQSVGDLYYSTWLSFAVSGGIFLHCYDQITRADDASKIPMNAAADHGIKVIPSPESVLV